MQTLRNTIDRGRRLRHILRRDHRDCLRRLVRRVLRRFRLAHHGLRDHLRLPCKVIAALYGTIVKISSSWKKKSFAVYAAEKHRQRAAAQETKVP